MKPTAIALLLRRSGILWLMGVVLLACFWPTVSIAAGPSDDERRQIEMLIGAYYLAVAAEDVDEVVDLHHWENSFERDKVTALVEQAFAVADSDFDRVKIQSIDLYPEWNIGLARVGVDYRVRNRDGTDSFSGHLEAAFVLVRGAKGWRIGKVGRAADLDLTVAASQFEAMSRELEETVPEAPVGAAEAPPPSNKLPKLATAPVPVVQTSASGTAATLGSSASASTTGGITFFALRRKTTGECVVVAGAEGISPGDTVYGAFPDFGQAQEAVTANCSGVRPETAPPVVAGKAERPLTADRLYAPDDTVTRGRWGTVVRIADDANLAGAREGGQVVEDGLYACPGDDGPTEAVYWHDGSPVTLRGTAAVVDCFGYCGSAGSVTFTLRGDGRDLWTSGLVRHPDPGRAFEVDLGGVRELRLITTAGGNGTAEDWAAWLDLELGEASTQQPTQTSAMKLPSADKGSSLLAVPRYEADESTTGVFVIDLKDGAADFVDRIKVASSSARRRTMSHNVFATLGRTADQSAKSGEILAGEIRSTNGAVTGIFLVDTSTGAAAYLDDLEDRPYQGIYRRVNGRPAEAIASNDGNFALIMRRDGEGGTDGAYLYHATTGQCVYFAHVDEMSPDPVVKFASQLPKMNGRVAAIALQDGSEATPQALLIDEGTGAVYRVGGLEHEPLRLTVTQLQPGLFEFFPELIGGDSQPRFVLIPGFSDNGATDMVFVVDAGTGRMAVLKDVRQGDGMRLVGSTKSLSSHLPETGGELRTLAGVPQVGSSGTTDGAWVFDSASGALLVLEKVRGPQNLKIHRLQRESN